MALLTDFWFGALERVNESLMLMTALVGIPALCLLIWGLKPCRESLQATERRIDLEMGQGVKPE